MSVAVADGAFALNVLKRADGSASNAIRKIKTSGKKRFGHILYL